MKLASNVSRIAAVLLASSALCSAQSPSPGGSSSGGSNAPYTEGSIWEVTMVRTKAGMTDDYLKNLAKNYRTVMDEAKKQNAVVSYKMFLGDAANKDDFDVMLMVEYKNMAALDGLRDKLDPIELKIAGGEDQQRQGSVKRAEIRDILGTKTMREITVK
jgi:hypothetical protein